jgi:hypothetical protein
VIHVQDSYRASPLEARRRSSKAATKVNEEARAPNCRFDVFAPALQHFTGSILLSLCEKMFKEYRLLTALFR